MGDKRVLNKINTKTKNWNTRLILPPIIDTLLSTTTKKRRLSKTTDQT